MFHLANTGKSYDRNVSSDAFLGKFKGMEVLTKRSKVIDTLIQ